ncbi:hypothetical protein BDF20DRAFT_666950 [Mycotypha africana]|uniref:uncharacterized protein n=1 Tax=Mycotypha africana TaxID=64632 RepID=UPI0023017184|nr:uncharacterized protein BDF20DRAFT_666950 [Mycotypha africana]KAI8973691.1 hypothetical protein BDF20DRAFT_666950 [Mycotypha africana]
MSEADRLSDINATFQCIQTLFDKADTDDEDPMLFELESKDSGFNEREEFERRLFMNSKQTNSNVLNASTSKSPFNADYPGRSPDVLEEAYPRRVKRKVMESPSPTDRAAGLVDIKSSPVDKGTMASSSSSYGLITPLNGFTTPTDYSRTIGSTGSFTGSLKREGIDTHSLEHNVSNLHISTNSAIKVWNDEIFGRSRIFILMMNVFFYYRRSSRLLICSDKKIMHHHMRQSMTKRTSNSIYPTHHTNHYNLEYQRL